eukprot:TRINITY_DN5967_c0_g1_i2.p1 TRINITY_DN5967_c0_g1~~TRINITY_DN5967_c0_g1_i2.p1  ORF type:complete len:133 (-),score=16.01 TRINITY_DN5967_c0_g1_i2:2205-2603(-)
MAIFVKVKFPLGTVILELVGKRFNLEKLLLLGQDPFDTQNPLIFIDFKDIDVILKFLNVYRKATIVSSSSSILFPPKSDKPASIHSSPSPFLHQITNCTTPHPRSRRSPLEKFSSLLGHLEVRSLPHFLDSS